MEIAELKVKKRKELGKGKAKHLRAQNLIPAIFYGGALESLPLTVELKDFKSLIGGEARTKVIVRLDIDGGKSETAIIKEIQKDPLRDSFLHIDFLKIALSEKIEATVPVTIVGDSPGVKEGGVLQHPLWEIPVKALPKDLPDRLEADVSNLMIGDVLRVADLKKTEGVEILTPLEEIVASVVPPTELKEEELVPEEEVAEPEVIGEEKEGEEEEKEEEEGKERAPEAKEEAKPKEGTKEEPKEKPKEETKGKESRDKGQKG